MTTTDTTTIKAPRCRKCGRRIRPLADAGVTTAGGPRAVQWEHVHSGHPLCLADDTAVATPPAGGYVLFDTETEAQVFVRKLVDAGEFNYFVGFRNAPPKTYGITYGWAAWAGLQRPHVKDIFPHVVH